MSKHQFCKLFLHFEYPKTGFAGLYGGSAAPSAFSEDTCVHIRNVTVYHTWFLFYIKFAADRLSVTSYTTLSAFY